MTLTEWKNQTIAEIRDKYVQPTDLFDSTDEYVECEYLFVSDDHGGGDAYVPVVLYEKEGGLLVEGVSMATRWDTQPDTYVFVLEEIHAEALEEIHLIVCHGSN